MSARGASIARIRCESSESPASDSRPASFAMTFWRQRGEAKTTFFRELDDRRRTKADARRTVGASISPLRLEQRHASASALEPALDELIERVRVGLAARCLHH